MQSVLENNFNYTFDYIYKFWQLTARTYNKDIVFHVGRDLRL